jgi:hypothetical protein
LGHTHQRSEQQTDESVPGDTGTDLARHKAGLDDLPELRYALETYEFGSCLYELRRHLVCSREEGHEQRVIPGERQSVQSPIDLLEIGLEEIDRVFRPRDILTSRLIGHSLTRLQILLCEGRRSLPREPTSWRLEGEDEDVTSGGIFD